MNNSILSTIFLSNTLHDNATASHLSSISTNHILLMFAFCAVICVICAFVLHYLLE